MQKEELCLVRLSRNPSKLESFICHIWKHSLSEDDIQEAVHELSGPGVVLQYANKRVFLEDMRAWFVLMRLTELETFRSCLKKELRCRDNVHIRDHGVFRIWTQPDDIHGAIAPDNHDLILSHLILSHDGADKPDVSQDVCCHRETHPCTKDVWVCYSAAGSTVTVSWSGGIISTSTQTATSGDQFSDDDCIRTY